MFLCNVISDSKVVNIIITNVSLFSVSPQIHHKFEKYLAKTKMYLKMTRLS